MNSTIIAIRRLKQGGGWCPVLTGGIAMLLAAALPAFSADPPVHILSADWRADRHELSVKLKARKGDEVNLYNAYDLNQLLIHLGRLRKDEWTARIRNPVPVPCAVLAVNESLVGEDRLAVRDTRSGNLPDGCAPTGSSGGDNQPPLADAGPDQELTLASGATRVEVTLDGSGSSDPDGSVAAYIWSGTPDPDDVQSPIVNLGEGTHVFTLVVRDDGAALSAPDSVQVRVNAAPPVSLVTEPVPELPFVNDGYALLAANDLGMHCADQDDQVFTILPPLNNVHAQLVRKGGDGNLPQLVRGDSPGNWQLRYSAASNPADPALDDPLNPPAAALAGTPRAMVSINSTSRNDPQAGVYKSNFWAPTADGPLGYLAYDALYFGLLDPADVVADLGLPIPDSLLLHPLDPCLADPAGCFGQQAMPGLAGSYRVNEGQPFTRFDFDVDFFDGVLPQPLGRFVSGVNWWAADGIPILPVDDAGRTNAYPIARVQALSGDTLVASTDIVLPVASEADCQTCHVAAVDCMNPDLPQRLVSDGCNETALSPTAYSGTEFVPLALEDAPGGTTEQKLLNAAKTNILRLHDAKHGADYVRVTGSGVEPAACHSDLDPADPDCLANQTPVQCSQCHYSPAVDLAQLGPVDDPSGNVQQTRHVSMSRAMHGFHGAIPIDNPLTGEALFPDMPAPKSAGRTRARVDFVLEQTCYQCHPGKRTQCLRGAMSSIAAADGGSVCQDCHGGMQAVGNDFSTGFPDAPGVADLSKRVPWASEPGCQSCHTGDAATNLTGAHPDLVAFDGIRLLRAFVPGVAADGSPVAEMIRSPSSRFAENENLFRLSKGHGGLMCEGCHGSTHAIWPVSNPHANDNLAAMQLQGHIGTISECSTCHGNTDLGRTLKGPHGMHPVGNTSFARGGHENMTDGGACIACHGADATSENRNRNQGTVLSRAAQARTLSYEDRTVSIERGEIVGCATCHTGGGD